MSNDTEREGESMDEAALLRAIAAQHAEIRCLAAAIHAQAAAIARLSATIGAGAMAFAPAPAGSTETFSDLWVRYRQTLPAAPWVRHVVNLMTPVLRQFGERRAAELRAFEWTDYRDGVRKPKVGVGTRNLELKRVKAMYAWAVREDRIPANPLAKVKLEPRSPARETEIDDGGLVRLLAAACDHLRVFVLVAIGSGMRHAEVRGLRWSAVDLERGLVRLSWTQTKTKKSRSPRLSPEAVEALRAFPRVIGSDFIFANPETREPYSTSWFYERWWAARAAAGLEAAPGDGEVHIHDMRHTYASRLARAGAKVTVIQRLLGHASLTSVARYLHVLDDELDEAHALLQKQNRKGPHAANHDASERNHPEAKILDGP